MTDPTRCDKCGREVFVVCGLSLDSRPPEGLTEAKLRLLIHRCKPSAPERRAPDFWENVT